MKSTFKQILCPLCKGAKYEVLHNSTLTAKDYSQEVITRHFKNSLSDYTKHGQIVKCSSCSLVYVNPIEKMPMYRKAYKDVVDDEYLKTEKFRKILSGNHLSHLEKYKKKGKILDVGCFAGFFLEIADKKKWIRCGIEPSSWASLISSKKGIRIIGKTIETTKIPREKFDAITMWDVIEHLSQPKEAIEALSASLKHKGIIAIGTPNVDSLLFKLLGSNHPYFIRMHLVLFSPKTLTMLLEQNGFKIREIYSYGRTYSIDYFLSRIEIKMPFIKFVRKIAKNKFFYEYPLTLNLRDEFTIIAEKK